MLFMLPTCRARSASARLSCVTMMLLVSSLMPRTCSRMESRREAWASDGSSENEVWGKRNGKFSFFSLNLF